VKEKKDAANEEKLGHAYQLNASEFVVLKWQRPVRSLQPTSTRINFSRAVSAGAMVEHASSEGRFWPLRELPQYCGVEPGATPAVALEQITTLL
jgi:hypothetical protein